MIPKIKIIIKNSLVFFIFCFLKTYFMFRPSRPTASKSLLVVKLDAIGDYVLFRNFLEILRRSDKYRDYKITFCGSDYVKDLAELLDSGYVDEFIWLNKKRIFYQPFHLFKIAVNLYGRFSIACQAAYSRDPLGDILVKFSAASERIGFRGDLNNLSASAKQKTDRWYTALIDISGEVVFEFFKNKEFFEKIIGAPIDLAAPKIDAAKLRPIFENNKSLRELRGGVILFPGAHQPFRRFAPTGFAAIAGYLKEKYSSSVVIAGGKDDKDKAAAIIANDSVSKIIDLTGQTNISELAALLSDAQLLISNDTAAVHIAMALGINTIVLSQFNHYCRFVPYPETVARGRMIYLTPDKYRDASREELIKKFSYGSKENINLISLDSIKSAIDKFIDQRD